MLRCQMDLDHLDSTMAPSRGMRILLSSAASSSIDVKKIPLVTIT
jgi:hypothetical protein